MDNLLYPELYYRIYPKVIDVINKNLSIISADTELTDEQLNNMVEEVYREMIQECPEMQEDPGERKIRSSRYRIQRPYYGRGRLARDIISIILISELLRRRYIYG
ncbi:MULTISPECIES: hypothetical protein [Tissierellales]|jgi:hypothetical protein|uniref:Uncharacterized protein n=1 Tax=Acidilutibacter cellobiosedens TaxID=2507161 RepID=A0A410QB57_9FIRM|nr:MULTISPECIES: hypothetical protein [Tissierellales]MBE6081956.1 hypothetical protein [Tissierellaceae bacterium]QAT61231.1 hypothetical protein EQM13_06335 [Acidilutibacter cellobiosedens]SCL93464.1 hypothetical protein PP176A_2481 [Sporanaerobacter sp. PP17-6a]